MYNVMTQSIAACAALFLTLGTISTIIAVPPAHAAVPIATMALA